MAATKQSQVIGLANDILADVQALMLLEDSINKHMTQYAKIAPSATWSAMATAPVSADGSLGTADGTPSAANVIDTRVAALSGLARAVKASDLVTAVSNLQGLQAWLTNQAVTQADRDGVFRPLVGG